MSQQEYKVPFYLADGDSG